MLTSTESGTIEHLGCVLIIDDEPDIAEVLSVYFTTSGYEVVTARQGTDGLVLAEIHRPDLVLLDIVMPGIDGVAVLQQLRQGSPALPVIMLTGVADVEVAKSTLRQGAFDYVGKPFEWEHLDRVVAAALTVRTAA
jgi:DNA-binding response OmpR family regulator